MSRLGAGLSIRQRHLWLGDNGRGKQSRQMHDSCVRAPVRPTDPWLSKRRAFFMCWNSPAVARLSWIARDKLQVARESFVALCLHNRDTPFTSYLLTTFSCYCQKYLQFPPKAFCVRFSPCYFARVPIFPIAFFLGFISTYYYEMVRQEFNDEIFRVNLDGLSVETQQMSRRSKQPSPWRGK